MAPLCACADGCPVPSGPGRASGHILAHDTSFAESARSCSNLAHLQLGEVAVARDVFAGELHLVASFLPGDLSPDQSEKGARELSEGGKTVSVSVSWSWGRRTRVLEQAPRWVRSGPPGNRDRRRTRRRRGGPLPKRPSSSIQARSPCTHLSRGDIHFKPTLAKREGTAPELGGPISHAEVVDALDFLPSEEDRPLLSPPLRGIFSRDA